MISNKTIALTIIGLSTLIACNNATEIPDVAPVEGQEVLVVEEDVQAELPNFQKNLTFKNFSFEISTTGEGSLRQLTIQPKGLEKDNQPIVLEIDGQAVNAEIADLNEDGFPEVLVYTTSAGSGSYGKVIGYSVNNGKSISEIGFTDLSESEQANTGYMGHDSFAVVENVLIRTFPIYITEDTNNNPTGGTRKIQYRLRNGEASRVFVLDKVID